MALSSANLLSGWPPTKVGQLPTSSHSPRTVPGLVLTTKKPDLHGLLKCWSAVETRKNENGESYLELPALDIFDKTVSWGDATDSDYPSSKLFIRKSYRTLATHFLTFASSFARKKLNPMLLAGSSGIGKSYFAPYFIWRLFHPDGIEVTRIPDTIIWRSQTASKAGFVYHRGHFYKCAALDHFWGTDDASDMLDNEDAWIIYDGSPPSHLMSCNTLVISSPGNLQANSDGGKHYFKTTSCKAYLPPWSDGEMMEVAQTVHGFDVSGDSEILSRYKRYGGIPRFVLQYAQTKNISDPLSTALSWTNVILPLTELGTDSLDHSKVAGTLMHLIPDETLLTFSYQWGSTEIMEAAFKRLFKYQKNKVTCLIKGAAALDIGSFYGLLFEPYFHFRISQQGYSGRIRRLLSASETRAAGTKKRNVLGRKADKLDISTFSIPKMDISYFTSPSEISATKYNVPTIPNFPTIDSLCPDRGEMYQITKQETHDIKGNHLAKVKNCFSKQIANGEKVKFIFVVPPERFREFTTQRIIDSAKKAGSKEMQVTWIEQYVLEVDVTPLTSTFDEVAKGFKRARNAIKPENTATT